MRSAIRVHLFVSAVALAVVGQVFPAAGEPLDKPELARRGKAATALLEVKPGQAYASAFCVHPSGLFVTSMHAVREHGGDSLKLILDAATPAEKSLQARVVRQDAESDLALLRATAEAPLPVLALGKADDLVELAEVASFGFPFGTALATEKGAQPAISVNLGSITSLRMKDKELHLVQLDAPLNPGNSGGPILNRDGKVVGVATATIRGAVGLNYAIPVTRLQAFLLRPELQFAPPAAKPGEPSATLPFEARLEAVLPMPQPVELELQLEAGGRVRRFPMAAAEGAYRATAVLVPQATGPAEFEATLRFARGELRGWVKDRKVSIGGQQADLSQIQRMKLGDGVEATTWDGKQLTGPLAAEPLAVRLADDVTVSADLRAAAEWTARPVPVPAAVAWTIRAVAAGQEVGVWSGQIPLGVAAGPARGDGAGGVAITRHAPLSEDVVEYKLPGVVADAIVGGGGRFLLLVIPSLKQVAVFDVQQAKIVKYLPQAEDTVKVAAGIDRAILYYPDSQIVHRWNLNTFEREVSNRLPINGTVKSIAMGNASRGPLLVYHAVSTGALDRCSVDFVDPLTLQVVELKRGLRQRLSSGVYRDAEHIRCSGDGQVFGCWYSSHSPSGLQSLVIRGNQADEYYQHDSVGHVVPSADGRTLYTAQGQFTEACKAKSSRNATPGWLVPAVHGDYYLQVDAGGHFVTHGATGTFAPRVTIFIQGDSRPVGVLPKVELSGEAQAWATNDFTHDKRLHFVPDAAVLVSIPATNDRLMLYRVDLNEMLEKSGIDYLFVTSRPPAEVRPGSTLRYEMVVKCKRGPASFRLETGPEGLAVSPRGEITWAVPSDAQGDQNVVVLVKDAGGQESFHTFRLLVRR